MKKIDIKMVIMFVLLVLGLSSVATASEARIKRVVYLGESEIREVNIQALYDASDALKISQPELSAEVLKAADVIAR